MTVFPRFETLPTPAPSDHQSKRVPFGIPELDAMMSGGLPRASNTIVVGGPGTGKTTLALQFLLAAEEPGETGLYVSFREGAPQLSRKSLRFALGLDAALEQRRIAIERFDAVNLDPDEMLDRVCDSVVIKNAKRVVFDSLIELKHALPRGRKRRALAALLEWLRARDVTALLLLEPRRLSGSRLDFADSPLEPLAENVLLMRNAESQGALRRSLLILKMRDTEHDHRARAYALKTGGVLPAAAATVGEEQV